MPHPDLKPRQRHVRSAGHSYRSSPTPISNRGRHVHSAGHSYRSSPTPTSNRGGGMCTAQAILIEVAPAESRSAGCGARRKAVRLSGRRHGVAPWASVKLPLRPAFRSRQAYPSKARQAQVCPRECPSREAQARACPEASRPHPRPRSPSKARVLPAYRHPWANRPVARWRRASFCRAAQSSRRGPSQRGRDECATRGGTPRALA